jgi:transposase-like protein
MRGGKSIGEMAREMGVGRQTLEGWLDQVGAVEQPLRPVEIRGEEQEEEPGRGLALVGR